MDPKIVFSYFLQNPEMVAGEKVKFVMRPPQVVRVGTKKTAFVNFTEIAKM
jgi:translation initiation factor 2 subunit 2